MENRVIENHTKKLPFRLLVLITTPKLAEKAAGMFKKGALPVQYIFHGEGTASSEIMDMLGLGSIDKNVLISTLSKHLADILLDKLNTELRLNSANSGVAFTMPLTGANHLILRMLMQNPGEHPNFKENEEVAKMAEKKMEEVKAEQTRHVLIAAIVNRGFSGDVMSAARAAGVKGGTVIQSRRIGAEEITSFWGLSVQEEKEIVMIIAETENKVKIMKSIGESCGMHSEAKGIVLSLPIDSVVGI